MSSSTSGGKRNWGSKASKEKEIEKQKIEEKNIEDNQQRSELAKDKPKPNLQPIIAKGKAVLSKYFHYFDAQSEANVTADMDSEITGRLSGVYSDAIEEYCRDNYESQEKQDSEIIAMDSALYGAIDFGIAIKLQQSTPDLEKKANKNLSILDDTKILLPEKTNIIIDQMGKTDLPNGNKFRLNSQHLIAKRHLVRSIIASIKDQTLEGHLVDQNQNQFFTLDKVKKKVEDIFEFERMIDTHSRSVKALQQFGKNTFLEQSKKDLTVSVDSTSVSLTIRLPSFGFKRDFENDEEDPKSAVEAYFNLDIFNKTTFTKQEDMIKFVSGLIVYAMDDRCIRNPNKLVKDYFNISGAVGDTTIRDIMANINVWNINDYFTDKSINELGEMVVTSWNTGKAKRFNKFLKLTELNFNVFGTESQIIQVEYDQAKSRNRYKNGFKPFSVFTKKCESSSVLKTSEHHAVLGLAVGYTKNIRTSPSFKVEHSHTNHEIHYEFIKSDIKISV